MIDMRKRNEVVDFIIGLTMLVGIVIWILAI